MRLLVKSGVATVLALGLSACGGSGSAPSGGASASATPAAAASALPSATASVAAADAAPADFAQCKACHAVEAGKNGIGPSLAGVFGRKSASVEGFAYSDAAKKLGVTWNEGNLDKWLENPMKMAPGTKMTFAGISDKARRDAVIDYLKTLK